VLADQAEELQHSIAFFRLPEDAVRPARTVAHRPAPVPVKRPAIKGTKAARLLAPRAGTRIDPSSRLRGFTLDLATGGPDAEDVEFGRMG
jgi:methyl-accepting chemotaxis protein